VELGMLGVDGDEPSVAGRKDDEWDPMGIIKIK
jgi:hypothetical protein